MVIKAPSQKITNIAITTEIYLKAKANERFSGGKIQKVTTQVFRVI